MILNEPRERNWNNEFICRRSDTKYNIQKQQVEGSWVLGDKKAKIICWSEESKFTKVKDRKGILNHREWLGKHTRRRIRMKKRPLVSSAGNET